MQKISTKYLIIILIVSAVSIILSTVFRVNMLPVLSVVFFVVALLAFVALAYALVRNYLITSKQREKAETENSATEK